jgi:hypothetical protein
MKRGYIEAIEERKGCEYCSAESPRDAQPIYNHTLGNLLGMEINVETYIIGNLLVTEFAEGEINEATTDERTTIQFCPFCGRKL